MNLEYTVTALVLLAFDCLAGLQCLLDCNKQMFCDNSLSLQTELVG